MIDGAYLWGVELGKVVHAFGLCSYVVEMREVMLMNALIVTVLLL